MEKKERGGGRREGEGEEGSNSEKDKLGIKGGAVKHAPSRFKDA